MDTATQPDERRLRRHRDTREEIVALAIDVMGAQGVAGLSLGELARRLGVRTPSLYTYFDSKAALFDELFRRGWADAHADLSAHLDRLGPPTTRTNPIDRGSTLTRAHLQWLLDHPALSQLMIFRPIPDWAPTQAAFAASLAFYQLLVDEVHAWRGLGLLRPDADPDELIENIATLVTGVATRQLSNEPGVPFDEGRASRHFSALFTAVLSSYLPEAHHDHHSPRE